VDAAEYLNSIVSSSFFYVCDDKYAFQEVGVSHIPENAALSEGEGITA